MQLNHSGIAVYIFLIFLKMSFLELGYFGNTQHNSIDLGHENELGLVPNKLIPKSIFTKYKLVLIGKMFINLIGIGARRVCCEWQKLEPG